MMLTRDFRSTAAPTALHHRPRWRVNLVAAAVMLVTALGTTPTWAQSAPKAKAVPKTAPTSSVRNSALDAELFYQLLVSELELRQGDAGVAYQVMLDAARRAREDQLFKRAVDIAIGARSADQAVGALKLWRSSLPRSRQAAEVHAQVLMALGRATEAQEPMRALLELTPVAERASMIAALPRLVMPGPQATAGATVIDEVLKPWQEPAATRLSALLAAGRVWAVAGDVPRSLKFAADAQKLDPTAQGSALLGLELWGQDPRAEALVRTYLQGPAVATPIRLVYARRLTSSQRYPEAMAVTHSITSTEPDFAPAWLMLGALQIELGQPAAAQDSLQRYLSLAQADAAPAQDEDDDGDPVAAAHQAAEGLDLNQAYLMLSQSAEQLKDFDGAQRWLDKLGEAQSAPLVVLRRANLLARQNKLPQALELVRALPDRNPDEARAKVMGETQLLRDARQWPQAYSLLQAANQRLPNDPDLLYEQALLADKLQRYDEMEQLLRRVIELKPDQQHAYNALGYSLAERNLQLPKARELVLKALELAPGDPFITDSMAWVEFRMGRREQALSLLQQAYALRADVEIAAHLGEVLWSLGREAEARRVWQGAQDRDATNDVLSETLTRLKVRL